MWQPTSLISLVLLLGCSHPAIAGAPPTDPTWVPTAEETAVYKLLSVRDPEPTCEAAEALSATPVQTLRVVVQRGVVPPWAQMRAAICLIDRHATEAEADLLAWATGSDSRGLALLVFDRLDTMPAETALRVAQAAIGGPHVADARGYLAKSSSEALKALSQ